MIQVLENITKAYPGWSLFLAFLAFVAICKTIVFLVRGYPENDEE